MYFSVSNELKYDHVFIDIIGKTKDSFVDGTVRTVCTVRFEILLLSIIIIIVLLLLLTK